MSSEESLNSRHRSAMTGQQRGHAGTRINFQEELKRLIDPDISESDLASLTVSTNSAVVGFQCPVSVQDGMVAPGKAHTHSASSLTSFPKVALPTVPMIEHRSMIIITLKGSNSFFFSFFFNNLLAELQTAQVAKLQLCANHVQHIGHISGAACHVPRGMKGQFNC